MREYFFFIYFSVFSLRSFLYFLKLWKAVRRAGLSKYKNLSRRGLFEEISKLSVVAMFARTALPSLVKKKIKLLTSTE